MTRLENVCVLSDVCGQQFQFCFFSVSVLFLFCFNFVSVLFLFCFCQFSVDLAFDISFVKLIFKNNVNMEVKLYNKLPCQ